MTDPRSAPKRPVAPCRSLPRRLSGLGRLVLLVLAIACHGPSTPAPSGPGEAASGPVPPDVQPPPAAPAACAAPLAFADEDLEREVRGAIGKPDGPLAPADVAALERLALGGERLESLAGIECLSGLRSLEVTWREFEEFTSGLGDQLRHLRMVDVHLDLAPVASLTQLEELRVVGAQVTDLSPLASLHRLRVLDLRRTSLEAPDFRSLAHGENETSDLRPLAGSTTLVELHLRYGGVETLGGVAALPALRVLDLGHNRLTDLAPLAGLRQLETLDLSYNRPALQDLGPLLGLPALRDLDVGWSLACARPHEALATLASRGVRVEDSCPAADP